jgi:pilus assembly protein CpaB
VTAADLGEISVPQKWAPANALTAPDQAIGLISATPLASGTDLEQSMLTQEPLLQPGNLEIAINIDAESGVAGQITQGSLVDVIAVYGAGSGAGNGKAAVAKVVVPYVRVLGVPQSASGTGSITLSVTPSQALEISLAEATASKLRLALVAPGSSTTAPPVPPITQTP